METVSSVTDQCVVSPLANIYPRAITHPDLRIGWEELIGESVNLDSELYGRFVQQRGHPTDCRVSDELLMAASQQYEQCRSSIYETYCTDEKSDALFWRHLSYSTLKRSTIQWL